MDITLELNHVYAMLLSADATLILMLYTIAFAMAVKLILKKL